ncbi:MAG: radical SAM protein [Thermoplasmata archaeon]|nr:radical SAM protein [Thermoplasmata archaeon]
MKINEISCKYAISSSRLPGYDYALNPYRGCGHGCAYCYAPDILWEEREWGTFVDVKRNLPNILSKEVKRKKKGVVGIGTVTDAYQPIEKEHEVTRHSLEQLLKEDFPICIQTKSDLVLRDLDLIKMFSDAEVGFTVAFLDEKTRTLFEPKASPIERRLKALHRLREEGIRTWAFVGPLLPHVAEEELLELSKKLAETGVDHVLVDKLNLKRSTRKNILRRVEGNNELQTTYSGNISDKDHYRRIARIIVEELESRGVNSEPVF